MIDSPSHPSLTLMLFILLQGGAVGLLVFYLLSAWNHTTLPVHVSKLLRPILDWKNRTGLSSITTRDEWEIWTCLRYPGWLASLLSCPVCQTPWMTLGIYALLHMASGIPPVMGLLAPMISMGVTALLLTQTRTAARRQTQRLAEPSDPKVAVAPHPASDRSSAERYAEFYRVFGLRSSMIEGAMVLDPTSLTDQYKEIMRFFVPSYPCWFAGCEDLRAAYVEEINPGGQACPGCKVLDVNRKYALLIKQILDQPLHADAI